MYLNINMAYSYFKSFHVVDVVSIILFSIFKLFHMMPIINILFLTFWWKGWGEKKNLSSNS